MRRFLLPAIVLAVVIAAAAMAGQANDSADPTGDTVATQDARLTTPLLNVRRAPEWLRQPASDAGERHRREGSSSSPFVDAFGHEIEQVGEPADLSEKDQGVSEREKPEETACLGFHEGRSGQRCWLNPWGRLGGAVWLKPDIGWP